MAVYSLLESKIVEMNYQEHDRITANTQVVTHLGFEAMGTAWKVQYLFEFQIKCILEYWGLSVGGPLLRWRN